MLLIGGSRKSPEKPKYNPGLTADLETASYHFVNAELHVPRLLDRGVNLAELIVSSAIRHERGLQDIDAVTGQPIADIANLDAPSKIEEYDQKLRAIASVLSLLVTLRSAPQVTPNDWGQILMSEAWYRAEQPA